MLGMENFFFRVSDIRGRRSDRRWGMEEARKMFLECCKCFMSLEMISRAFIPSCTPCLSAFSVPHPNRISLLPIVIGFIGLTEAEKETIEYSFAYLRFASQTQLMIIRFSDSCKKTYFTHNLFEIVAVFSLVFFHGR